MLEVFKELKTSQMAVWKDGEDIELSFVSEPDMKLIEVIKEQKAEILAFLQDNCIFSESDFEQFVSGDDNDLKEIETYCLATSLQQGFVYHYLSQPHDDAYRVQLLMDYQRGFDVELYQQAWRLASARYPILRTSFNWDGDILQVVSKSPSIGPENFTFKDISMLPLEVREQAILEIQREDRQIPFDLSRPGLIRFTLIKQSENLITVLKTEHHSIGDGWSAMVLMDTVHDFYDALARGESPKIEAETAYLEAQAYYLKHQDDIQHYWDSKKPRLNHVNDLNPLLSVTTDLEREKVLDKPNEQILTIQGTQLERLKSMCQHQGVTLNVSLQFAWHKLIQTYTQDAQTIVGVTVSGRDIPVRDIESSVGLYINTLPLSVDWEKEASVKEVLTAIQQGISELNTYSSASLAEIQGSASRLFHSLFVFENYPSSDACDDAGIASTAEFRHAVEKVDYPLSIKAYEQQGSLLVGLNYSESLLTLERANQLLSQFEMILAEISDDPNQNHQSISLLTDQERHQLLHRWNDTDKPYPQDKTLSALFEAQAAKTPEQVALVFENETLSYGELNERANQLAHAIRARYESANGQALSADTFIGLYMDRSLAMVVSILAVLKAGAAYVPVSPEYPQERVEFILSDTQTDLVLTQTQYQAELSTLTTASLLLVDDAEVFSGQSSATPEAISDANDLAYVIYTSGTTGKPKGVMIEHRNVAHLVTAQRQHFECDAYQNALWFADYVFDASVSELFVSLLSGHTLFISSTETRKDPSKLAALLSKENIQLATLPPAILHQLDAGCFASFECLVMAGEAPTIELYEKFNAIPRLLNAYGPTESTVCASVNRYQQGDSATNIGHAIPNSRLYVLSDSGNLAPINVVGELYISGAGLARGYLNRDDLTAESFINNPFASEADKAKGYTRLYKTGDLVRRLADGRLEFLGRNDSQVKIRGYRVELGEIESALNGLADVAQAVVVDKVKGGNKYLAAYVVAEAGHTLSLDGVRAQLSTQLPDYMVPAAFTELEHIPLTINGKVDKRALPAPSFVSEDEYVAPRNELEAQLCELWQDVLGVEQVGVHDNFFRIGGNSINAIKLTAAIRDVLSVDVPLALLFEYKTVAGLAAQLGEQDELLVIPRSTLAQAPLSFAQERLLFIERFEQGSDVYHIPSLVKLNSDAELDKLLTAINVVATRHPVMKSVYHTNDAGEDYQVVLAQDIELERHVLDSESTLLASLSEAVATPFDLTTEMSLRLHHFVVEGDNTSKGYLLMLWHHIGFDGWSADIFMSELDEVYGALLSERKIELPVLEISYADYASWQRDYLSGEVLEQQQGYWQTQLSGFETLVLPTDHSRPAHIDYRGQDVAFELDEALSEQLRALAQSQETTLYTVLLSGFYVTLAALSGQDDIVIGTPSDNRHHAQTQSLIGFFVNSLALRAGVNGAQSLSALIAQVHGVVTQAKVHQELPFEKLVDLLDVERDPSRHPIFQVMFDVVHFSEESDKTNDLPFNAPEFASEQSLYSAAKTDLSLSLIDNGKVIRGSFNYAVSLFEASSIERMRDMYLRVLQALVNDVTQTVAQVDVLSEQERHQLLYQWNDTDAAYPQDKTLQALFEEQAVQTPEQVAVVFAGEALSYGELNERANQLAHAIRAEYEVSTGKALSADTFIGLYVARSVEMVVSILAVLKAGAAYVPISPEYPSERVEFILSDTQASLVLTQSQYQQTLSALTTASLMCVDDRDTYAAHSTAVPAAINDASDLAYVIYTSGTTGKPKGVMIEHRSVVNLIDNQYRELDFTADEVVIWLANYIFDASVEQFFLPLLNGSRLVVPSDDEITQPEKIIQHLITHQVTHLDGTPSYLQALGHPGSKSAIRRVIAGGESLISELRSLWGDLLINEYGPTEVTVTSIQCLDSSNAKSLNTIGTPISNTRAYVVNDAGQLAAMNTPGELYLGGVGVARGYLNRDDLTGASFIDNPFASEADKAKGYTRLYKTGDLVRWQENGQLEYLGRNDSQVKIRGYRIELGEIESALNEVADIAQAVVIDKVTGSNKYLAAYVVVQAGKTLSIDSVREQLSGRLPDYMVPSTFTELEQLPLTINGKLDKRALPEPALVDGRNYVAPRNTLETQLCQIWQSILGLEKVGIHDNFFRIGGDSIVSIQLVSELRKHHFNLQVKTIFDAPTVAKLAQQLSQNQTAAEIQTEQGTLEGKFELLPVQQAFFEQPLAKPEHWNQAFMLKIPGEITEAEVSSAINRLALQHDMLRCRFEKGSSGYEQCYYSEVSIAQGPFRTLDVSTLNTDELDEVLTAWQSSFDYENGPLWMAGFLTGYDDGSARVFFAFHHLIIDTVSWRIIADDMQQLLTGKQLSAKGSSYRQWVKALQLHAESIELEVPYWQDVMDGYETLADEQRSHFCKVSISKALTTSLLYKANSAFNTDINELLLSALAVALKDTFGRQSNHIILEGHGRESIDDSLDISHTVGWFTSLYPVKLSCHSALADTIINTKEGVRRIPDKGIGFGVLCQADKLAKHLPSICFNYLGQMDQPEQQDEGYWQIAYDSCGETISRENADDLVLNINGAVRGGQLQFGINSLLTEAQTAAFCNHFESALALVIQECERTALKGGIKTPSDYQAKSLTVAQLQGLAIQNIEEIYPATSLQQGFIFHYLNQPQDDAYRVQLLLDYHQQLDLELYQQAWRLASIKFPILRTAFDWNGEVIQVISSDPSIDEGNFDYIDISGLAPEQREEAIQSIQQQDREKGFDLSKPGLIRFTLIKQEASLFTLLETEHHSIADGWSGAILLNAVHDYYDALVRGETPEVQVETAYTEAQTYYQAQRGETEAYWDKAKKGFAEPNDINSLLSARVDLTKSRELQEPDELKLVITGEEYQQLKNVCQQQGLTVNVALQFAWHKLMQVYTRDEQTIVGTTVSGRDIPIDGIESSVGLYINTLPLTVNWRKNATVLEVLQEIQSDIAALNSYSSVSLAKLQSNGERLFHSLFVFENFPSFAGEALTGVAGSVEFRQSVEKNDYPLSIKAYELDGSLVLGLNYCKTWLRSDKANQLLSQIKQILEVVSQQPLIAHEQISLLSKDESQQLLNTLQHTEVAYPKDQMIHQLFEEQAKQSPDNIALIFEQTELTYAEVNRRANQLANAIRNNYEQLHNAPLAPDTLIALYLDRSLEMVISILAILKAGGAYVPMSPDHPNDRVQFMLEDTQASIVLSQRHQLTDLTELTQHLDAIPMLLAVDDASDFECFDEANLETINQPSDLAYVIYTSGTTGKPKGVMVPHTGAVNRIDWMQAQYPLAETDRVLQKTPYIFDVSVWELLWANWVGAAIVIASPNIHQDPELLNALIKNSGITTLHFVPTMLTEYCKYIQQDSEGLPSSVNRVFCSGEALTMAHVRDFEKISPRLEKLINLYGPTEASIDVSYFDCCDIQNDIVPIGKAIQNTTLLILDEQLQLVPIGVPGELYIGGVGLARGYLNRDELTKERFIRNPFTDANARGNAHDRLYKTGDVVRWLPDGNIEYLGRNDSQVKIRGFRVELGEIEARLSAQEEIKQAVVVVHKRDNMSLLAAYLVAEGEQQIDWEVFRNRLAGVLPNYMIPSSYTLIDSVPFTINGKLDIRALPEPELAQKADYQAPTNALETQLCKIWQALLGLDKVGIDENFFRIGGDSIISIQLVAKLRQAGFSLHVKAIYDAPTIQELAVLLSQSERAELKTEQGILLGDFPLLPIQQDFFNKSLAVPNHWNQSFMVKIPASITSEFIELAIAKLALQHDILRCTFSHNEQGYCQRYHDEGFELAPLKALDVSTLAASEIFDRLSQWQSHFDINRGPLWQVAHLTGYADQSARLFFSFHHLIIDAVSWRIVADDMRQLLTGAELPPKGSSYRQWVEAVSDYANDHQNEIAYWQDIERNQVSLPTPSMPRFSSISLSAEKTHVLLHQANSGYNTEINDLLLSALAIALQATFGHVSNSITLEGHGREVINEQLDVSQTLGWFTTKYPVQLNCKEVLGDTIVSTKEMLRKIPCKGLGYGALVQQGALSGKLPPIIFNYLGQLDANHGAGDVEDWQIVDDACGMEISPENNEELLLNINGVIQSGVLEFTIQSQLSEQQLALFTEQFNAALLSVIQQSEDAEISGGVMTPSDFAVDDLSLNRLRNLESQFEQDNNAPASAENKTILEI
ncbi:amino acid adenylation domain-containing protein (plasmid) [Pseudoalteromonas sp. T1lg65]|uniref:amino acid adenylation domain-containing protein n=1 Tax=Pseudoalteromonas sp. T1lg65 TaxID=2077101 RepID=UPI003F78F100